MMIGLPGCGKSTFVNRLRAQADVAVISMDAFRQLACTELGIAYADSMVEARNLRWDSRNRAIHAALTQMMGMIAVQTYEAGRSLVWDRTNLTRAERRERFDQTPGYLRVGVHAIATLEQSQARCAAREVAVGRTIPAAVLQKMAEQFEMPEEAEFDLLIKMEIQSH